MSTKKSSKGTGKKSKPNLRRLVFDIETNGLWPEVSHTWLIMTHDLATGEKRQYSNDDTLYGSIEEGLEYLSTADVLIGHNIVGYDVPVLRYLHEWEPKAGCRLIDTWLLSLLLRYQRPHRHGLDGWGQHLKHPKGDSSAPDFFLKYSQEMLDYGMNDVDLNVKVYRCLQKEVKSTAKINPLIKLGIQTEMEFGAIEAAIRFKGWDFDAEEAERLAAEIGARKDKLEKAITKRMGLICISKDKKGKYTFPKFTKAGKISVPSARWFGYDPAIGLEDECPLSPDAPYTRVEFVKGNAGSDKHLKTWLYRLGWVPDDWNYERVGRDFVQKSPKLTESSLAPLGKIGKAVTEYNSIANRHSILRGWLANIEHDGRLHGRMWTIGTPTMRCRHEVVANLPKVGTLYGEEMRKLFLPPKGCVIIGADSSGNQMRGFCHYIGNEDFTKETIEGDVHTKNSAILRPFITDFLHDKSDWSTKETVPKEVRDNRTKRFLYAYLFGGGKGKMGELLTGKKDAVIGGKAIEVFQSSIPGLQEFRDKSKAEWEYTKERFGEKWAHVRAIDGRICFVTSAHKILTAYLQSLEAITCKAAAVWLDKALKKEGIPFRWLLHYHDELAFAVRPKHEARAKELAVMAFTEAPKLFGVNIMTGEAKSGKNYAEVH
jgi:DNA polymerase-1